MTLTRTYSDAGQRVLSALARYYHEDDAVHSVIEPLARELDRLEQLAERVRSKAFPQNDDDEFGFLTYWETILELPVNPPDTDITERQNRVLAAFRSRSITTGREWVERFLEVVGGPASYQEEQDDDVITVTLPYSPTVGTTKFGVIQRQLRRITPAHKQINYGFEAGFLVGVSRVGDNL